jgi:DNA (cytosine-5)-methyltransferase 1
MPKLNISFNEPPVNFGSVKTKGCEYPLNNKMLRYWENRKHTDLDIANIAGRIDNRINSFFNHKFIKDDKVSNTITSGDLCTLYSEPRYRNDSEVLLCGSFPLDYNFKSTKIKYLIGMSVPPVMTAQVAHQVYLQWFK